MTKGGVKTWYEAKRDSGAQKMRSVKLAQGASKGAHCAWAKKQKGATLLDIYKGNVLTKDERETQKAVLGIPTFAEALEQYIEHRTRERASGKAPMVEKTAKDYRITSKLRFSRWADVHVDELPILEINQYLNTLQLTRPNGAQTASVLIENALALLVNHLFRLCDAEAFALIPGFKDIRPDHCMGLAISIDGLFYAGQKAVIATFGHQVRKDVEPFVRDRLWL